MSDAAIKDALPLTETRPRRGPMAAKAINKVQGEVLLRAGLGGPAPTSGPPKPPTHKA
jgi:hypothetical protein